MLGQQMSEAGVVLRLQTSIDRMSPRAEGWSVGLSDGSQAQVASVVIATGGKSIPKMGATGWAYDIARQFDIRVTETRPALVPLTFEPGLLETLSGLAGVALDARIASVPADKKRRIHFDEAMLFTHRGLSGPAILQISSYWREGEAISATMAPGVDVFEALRSAKAANGRQAVHTALSHIVPRRLAEALCAREGLSGNLADLSDKALRRLDQAVNGWSVKPVGSEGYRTAEVTLGGVDTAALDQQTLQVKTRPGLYFIGEAVDVTGWLGGYNFQWAWSSGWAAGQSYSERPSRSDETPCGRETHWDWTRRRLLLIFAGQAPDASRGRPQCRPTAWAVPLGTSERVLRPNLSPLVGGRTQVLAKNRQDRPMPLLMCPNDNGSMQTLERNGVQFDMCPTCRGVWLDRGELEKLMAAATEEGRASAPQAAPAQAYAPPPQPAPHSQPWGGGREPYRDERPYKGEKHRDDRYRDDDYRYKKKKRDSIFDIFD
ncbi:hypothetical protein LTR94_024435 [Friedmanniomyces endolithicus]|nr:hypothetical protein LTR94_024435 [Friedmanniomyces endolithicus]